MQTIFTTCFCQYHVEIETGIMLFNALYPSFWNATSPPNNTFLCEHTEHTTQCSLLAAQRQLCVLRARRQLIVLAEQHVPVDLPRHWQRSTGTNGIRTGSERPGSTERYSMYRGTFHPVYVWSVWGSISYTLEDSSFPKACKHASSPCVHASNIKQSVEWPGMSWQTSGESLKSIRSIR